MSYSFAVPALSVRGLQQVDTPAGGFGTAAPRAADPAPVHVPASGAPASGTPVVETFELPFNFDFGAERKMQLDRIFERYQQLDSPRLSVVGYGWFTGGLADVERHVIGDTFVRKGAKPDSVVTAYRTEWSWPALRSDVIIELSGVTRSAVAATADGQKNPRTRAARAVLPAIAPDPEPRPVPGAHRTESIELPATLGGAGARIDTLHAVAARALDRDVPWLKIIIFGWPPGGSADARARDIKHELVARGVDEDAIQIQLLLEFSWRALWGDARVELPGAASAAR
jgi:hypothetical protein